MFRDQIWASTVRGRQTTDWAGKCRMTAGFLNTATNRHKSTSLQQYHNGCPSIFQWTTGMQEAAHHISCSTTCTFSFLHSACWTLRRAASHPTPLHTNMTQRKIFQYCVMKGNTTNHMRSWMGMENSTQLIVHSSGNMNTESRYQIWSIHQLQITNCTITVSHWQLHRIQSFLESWLVLSGSIQFMLSNSTALLHFNITIPFKTRNITPVTVLSHF